MILIIFTGVTTLSAQSSVERKFEKFIRSSTQGNGKIEFESICFIDSSYTFNEYTEEFKLILTTLNNELSKSKDYQIERNRKFITASFTALVYNEIGKEIGIRSYRIEFIKKRKTFEILGVTVNHTNQWKKAEGCWKKVRKLKEPDYKS